MGDSVSLHPQDLFQRVHLDRVNVNLDMTSHLDAAIRDILNDSLESRPEDVDPLVLVAGRRLRSILASRCEFDGRTGKRV
jgi:hypothetical protein